jgi:hypothetical protein
MNFAATEAGLEQWSATHLLAECELVLLHGSELKPSLGRKFKAVDVQLHKAPDGCLSQTTRAGTDESRLGQRLLTDRAITYPSCSRDEQVARRSGVVFGTPRQVPIEGGDDRGANLTRRPPSSSSSGGRTSLIVRRSNSRVLRQWTSINNPVNACCGCAFGEAQ